MVYSIFDLFGDIGGFGEAIYFFCLIIVSGYANRMLNAQIIQNRFQVRLDTGGTRIKDLVQAKTNKRKSVKRRTADEATIPNMRRLTVL